MRILHRITHESLSRPIQTLSMAWLTGAHRHMLAHTPMAGVLGGSPRTSLDSPQVVLSRLGSSDVNSPNVPVNDFLEKKTIQRTHARDYVQG